MFDELEHKRTPEERKLLILEIVGAVAACALVGGVAFWFFATYGITY